MALMMRKKQDLCQAVAVYIIACQRMDPMRRPIIKPLSASLQPEYYANTLAFMFESRQVWRLTRFAYNADFRQKNYLACWQGLKANFPVKSMHMIVITRKSLYRRTIYEQKNIFLCCKTS